MIKATIWITMIAVTYICGCASEPGIVFRYDTDPNLHHGLTTYSGILIGYNKINNVVDLAIAKTGIDTFTVIDVAHSDCFSIEISNKKETCLIIGVTESLHCWNITEEHGDRALKLIKKEDIGRRYILRILSKDRIQLYRYNPTDGKMTALADISGPGLEMLSTFDNVTDLLQAMTDFKG